MVVYGYAKSHKYTSDGTLLIQTRVPNIHGPYRQSDSRGRLLRTYVRDEDLPFYQSLILPYLPEDGQIVAMIPISNSADNDFLIIGITGGSYQRGVTNLVQ